MATVLNAYGVPLPYSGASINHFSATNSGPALFGSAGNDSMWGDASVSVTMYGGLGDDIYYLYSTRNKAVEYLNGGIDTINTWMSYRLPDNFENLIVTGDKRFAFGNLGDNIITGGSGQQTLDGLRGNDVLKGGAGSDIFVVTKGNGSDLILDFGTGDSVRVGSYGFTSFEQVRVPHGPVRRERAAQPLQQRVSRLRQQDDRPARRWPVQARLGQIGAAPHLRGRVQHAQPVERVERHLGFEFLVGGSKRQHAHQKRRTAMVCRHRLWPDEVRQSVRHRGRRADDHGGPRSERDPPVHQQLPVHVRAADDPRILLADLRLFRDPGRHAGKARGVAGLLAAAGGRFVAAGARCHRDGGTGSEQAHPDRAFERDRKPHDCFAPALSSRTRPASTPMASCGPRTPWSGISTMSRSRGPPRLPTCTSRCTCWSTWPSEALRERRRTGSPHLRKCRSTMSMLMR